jgi:kynurenine formamidase
MNRNLRLTSSLALLTCVLSCLWGYASWTVQSPQMGQSLQGPDPQAPPYPPPVVTAAEFDRWMKELSNWGRWGKDDQLGAVNLITAAKRKQALALVREAILVSLAHAPLAEKAVDVASPFERDTALTVINSAGNAVAVPVSPSERDASGAGGVTIARIMGARDRYSVSYHGKGQSHIDALCHFFYKGQMYNGFSYKEITKQGGCGKNDIRTLHSGIMTRALLIDIPRLKGVPYLEPYTPVYPKDIEAWEKKVGIKVSAGDAILLRTGRWARRAKIGPFAYFAGYHVTVAPWLKSRDVAILGSDVSQELDIPLPAIEYPIHTFAVAGLGAVLLDNLDLEAVAETAARLNRWEFMLTVAPIPVEGGTGSLINPIATF